MFRSNTYKNKFQNIKNFHKIEILFSCYVYSPQCFFFDDF